MSADEIGPFVAGELPGQIQQTFTDASGTALNLTGYTVRYHYKRHGTTAVTRNGVLVTAASGIVGYTPVAADLNTAGVYSAEFSVTNGTNTYYSDKIVYRVKEALGAAS